MMPRRFLGPIGGPIVFFLVAALVFAILGWVTSSALRVEDAQRESAFRADHEKDLRIALWRLDARMLPALGVEDTRPFHEYRTFSTEDPITVYGPACAPLLAADLPDWMQLHFQVETEGSWESPQVLTDGARAALRRYWPELPLRNASKSRAELLAALGVKFPARQAGEAFAARERTYPTLPMGNPPFSFTNFDVGEKDQPASSMDEKNSVPLPAKAPPPPRVSFAPPSAPFPQGEYRALPALPDGLQGNNLDDRVAGRKRVEPEDRRRNAPVRGGGEQDASAPVLAEPRSSRSIAPEMQGQKRVEESATRLALLDKAFGDARRAASKPSYQNSYQLNPAAISPASRRSPGQAEAKKAAPMPLVRPLVAGAPPSPPASSARGSRPRSERFAKGMPSLAKATEKERLKSAMDARSKGFSLRAARSADSRPSEPLRFNRVEPNGLLGMIEDARQKDLLRRQGERLHEGLLDRQGAPRLALGKVQSGVMAKAVPRAAAEKRAESGPGGPLPGVGAAGIGGRGFGAMPPRAPGAFSANGIGLGGKPSPQPVAPTPDPMPPAQLEPVAAPAPIPPAPALAREVNAPPVAVHLGSMHPQWITAADGTKWLVLVRSARVENKKTVFQGVILDWPKLQSVLKDEVKDLFPEATLGPVFEGNGGAREEAMTALPIRLDPGPASGPPPAGWTPLRIGLILAWIAAAIAFTAVGLSGWTLIDLAERRIRFVSAVTHELRTPLTSLRLYLDLLLSGMVRDEEKRREYLSTLNVESDRLHRLIDNVLGFARLERRSKGRTLQPMAVAEFLEQIRQTWSDRVAADGKELVIASTLPAEQDILTDESLVGQIVGNLIDNARKYTRGAADPRIEVTARLDGPRRLAIEVEDRGPGVPPREHKAIFKPFRRGESADAKAGGAGLGLALSREWAEVLGGKLTYRAAEGGLGACFRLELPL